MIKGLRPSLAEAGKIKIGELAPKRVGKSHRLPTKLDHFKIVGTTRNKDGDLEPDEQLMAALDKDSDGKIRRMPIVLHSDELDDVFPHSYALYKGRSMTCRGDGETATRWEYGANGKRTGNKSACNCPCDALEADPRVGRCKPNGTLHCSIAVNNMAIAGSVHKWRTTSLISVQQMAGSIEHIKAHVGALRGLPLWLVVRPVQVNPPNAPASTVYCCHLDCRATDLIEAQSKMLELAKRRQELASVSVSAGPRLLVEPPAGDHETEEEQAEVAQEFYPEEYEDDDDSGPEPATKTKAVLAQLEAKLGAAGDDCASHGFEPEPEPKEALSPAMPEEAQALIDQIISATSVAELRGIGSTIREKRLEPKEIKTLQEVWSAKVAEIKAQKKGK